MDYSEKIKCIICNKQEMQDYKETLEDDKTWHIRKYKNCGYHNQQLIS